MNILEVRNLTVRFDNKEVLKDISFSLAQGEFLAIVGPNGAGKSTLVKTVLKDNRHYSGTIIRDPSLRHIGYVAQQNSDGTYFPATAAEVIRSGLCNRYLHPFMHKEDKKRIDTVIGELEIAPLLNKSFFTLSGGQKRAVLIARAFVASDRFLILDEPTTGLDVTSTERLYECIRNLNQKYKTTICMISHDLRTVVEQASKVLCIEHQLRFFGESSDFIKTDIYTGLLEHTV